MADFQKLLNEVVWGGPSPQLLNENDINTHQGLAGYFKQVLQGLRTRQNSFVGELEGLHKVYSDKVKNLTGTTDVQRHSDYYKSDIPDLIAQLRHWKSQATDLYKRINALMVSLSGKLEVSRGEARNALKQLTSIQEELRQANADLKQEGQTHSLTKEALTKAEEKLVVWQRDYDAIEERLGEVETERDTAVGERDHEKLRADTAVGERDHEKLRADTVEGQIADLRQQYQKIVGEMQQAQSEIISDLRDDHEMDRATKEAAIRELKDITDKFEEARQRIRQLGQELQDCQDDTCQEDLVAALHDQIAELQRYKDDIEGKKAAGNEKRRDATSQKYKELVEEVMAKYKIEEEEAKALIEKGRIVARSLKTKGLIEGVEWYKYMEASGHGELDGRAGKRNTEWARRVRYVMFHTKSELGEAIAFYDKVVEYMKDERIDPKPWANFTHAFKILWNSTSDPYERLAKIIGVSPAEIKDKIGEAHLKGDITDPEDFEKEYAPWAVQVKDIIDKSQKEYTEDFRFNKAIRIEYLLRTGAIKSPEEFKSRDKDAKKPKVEHCHYGSFNLNEYLSRAYAVDSRRRQPTTSFNTSWIG